MITKKTVDGFVPNSMGRFLGGKGRPSSCFVTIGRGGVEVTIRESYTYPKISLLRGVVLSQSTFHLVVVVL